MKRLLSILTLVSLVLLVPLVSTASPVRSALGANRLEAHYSDLPYDAEVEYLESRNANLCRIHTGIKATATMGFECVYETVRESSAYWAGYAFGGYAWTQSRIDCLVYWERSGSINMSRINYGSSNITSSTTTVPIGTVVSHVVRVDPLEGIWLDGEKVLSSPFTAVGANNRYPYIVLFARGTESLSGFTVSGLDGGEGRCIRISRFKCFDNGEMVCDFIPVRFTNEFGLAEGAMYDCVSGELFRNAGMGSFIIGPDIVPLEY